jgi:hypothetical protein
MEGVQELETTLTPEKTVVHSHSESLGESRSPHSVADGDSSAARGVPPSLLHTTLDQGISMDLGDSSPSLPDLPPSSNSSECSGWTRGGDVFATSCPSLLPEMVSQDVSLASSPCDRDPGAVTKQSPQVSALERAKRDMELLLQMPPPLAPYYDRTRPPPPYSRRPHYNDYPRDPRRRSLSRTRLNNIQVTFEHPSKPSH